MMCAIDVVEPAAYVGAPFGVRLREPCTLRGAGPTTAQLEMVEGVIEDITLQFGPDGGTGTCRDGG